MGVKEGTISLSKWGNSLSIRLPKKVLDELSLKDKDELLYSIIDGKILLEPKHENRLLEQLFEGYDLNAEYPFEVIDKGVAVGEELY